MYNMYEVKNPVYQNYEDIEKQYDNNLIVMTNVKWGERERLIGGIVRYYGDDRKKLTKIWADLAHSDKYGECFFKTLYDVDHSYLRMTGSLFCD